MRPRHATVLAALASATLAAPAAAQTELLRPNVYLIDGDVDFEIANTGNIDFLFNWSDASGTYTDIVDPTLYLVGGNTYTFRRITSAHPFVITDSTLPVSGTDGEFSRDTFDGDEIDAATLKPIEDFTADPAPTDDFISWSFSGYGGIDPIYYYTCRVTTHPDMTGLIRTIPECYADYINDGVVNTIDLLQFLNDWSAGLISADVNLDGVINTLDVLEYLNLWNAGC